MFVSRAALNQVPYRSARSLLKGEGWIFLDANESPMTPRLPAFELQALNRYPDPDCDRLRKKIAAHYGVLSSQVLIGSGTDELIDLLVQSFVREGKSAATPVPTYGVYRVCCSAHGRQLHEVPLANDFKFEVGRLLAQAPGADLIFLCSPNNPTGGHIPSEQIRDLLREFEGLVVVDEAYGEFSDAQQLPSGLELISESERLVVLRTFSKAFGAAGLRLGYALGSERSIALLKRMKLPYNVARPVQSVGELLWDGRSEMERNVQEILRLKKSLISGLQQLGCQTVEGTANFLLFKPPAPVSSPQLFEILLRERIVLRHFPEPPMNDFLRVSVGLQEENEQLLLALREKIG